MYIWDVVETITQRDVKYIPDSGSAYFASNCGKGVISIGQVKYV